MMTRLPRMGAKGLPDSPQGNSLQDNSLLGDHPPALTRSVPRIMPFGDLGLNFYSAKLRSDGVGNKWLSLKLKSKG